jgi:hypothetical protein
VAIVVCLAGFTSSFPPVMRHIQFTWLPAELANTPRHYLIPVHNTLRGTPVVICCGVFDGEIENFLTHNRVYLYRGSVNIDAEQTPFLFHLRDFIVRVDSDEFFMKLVQQRPPA